MARGEETISTREAAATSVKFYSTWFCPYAHRVWIALEFKAVPYTWIECVLYERDPSTKVALPLDEKRRRTPGFVECCPRGLVPGIECGGTKMYESMVLLEFIDEAFSGPALLPPPSEPASRARVKLWVAFVAERVIPCYYRLLMAQGDEQRAKARQSLLDGLRTLSTEALVHPKGPFLMGDTFGLFEAALLPWWFRMVVLAAYRGWELPAASDEPTLHALHAWGDACAAHPACAATLVDRDRLIASNIGYADNTATSTCAQIMRAGADMGARAPAPAPAGGVEGVLFSRLSSNNSARVRAWLYARGLEARYELRQLSHEQMKTDAAFLAASPLGKVPALALASGESIVEAAVIVAYLEERHAGEGGGAPLLPAAPAARARVRMLVQLHDIHLASPNSAQRGHNAHNMGCLFLPPPGGAGARTLDAPTRAAKLAELWRQLDLLEQLVQPPYAAGAALSVADLSLFPTFVYFDFYLPRVFGCDAWHGRPRLRAWFLRVRDELPLRRVLGEMEPALLAKERSGDLDAIVAQTKGEGAGLKWQYP